MAVNPLHETQDYCWLDCNCLVVSDLRIHKKDHKFPNLWETSSTPCHHVPSFLATQTHAHAITSLFVALFSVSRHTQQLLRLRVVFQVTQISESSLGRAIVQAQPELA